VLNTQPAVIILARRVAMRSGEAYLPLHDGYVPRWLYTRMVRLGSAVLKIVVEEFGSRELILRIGDPVWFQALGCVLGFDWHSSGLTTVVTAALKEAASRVGCGVFVAGGKGRASRAAPDEIYSACRRVGLDPQPLIRASRLAAKVDNALVLDGYTLYHHAFFFDAEGNWAVVQQGMNVEEGYARRYHWTSESARSFVVEPHSGLIGEKRHSAVIDMTARESEEARRVGLDILRERDRLRRDLARLREHVRGELDKWILGGGGGVDAAKLLYMPRRIDWEAVRRVYELQPRTFEELVEVEGVGPGLIRAVALVAEVIYGAPPSKRDPVRYTFAVGGKDGVPFPVNRKVYDELISFFENVASRARGGDRRRLLERLSRLLPGSG